MNMYINSKQSIHKCCYTYTLYTTIFICKYMYVSGSRMLKTLSIYGAYKIALGNNLTFIYQLEDFNEAVFANKKPQTQLYSQRWQCIRYEYDVYIYI